MVYRAGMAVEPRTLVAQPGAFGKVSGTLRPVDGVEETDPRYEAAVLQHVLARYISDALKYRETTIARFLADVPDGPGLSVDRQRRVLRGETSATYADLAFWSGHFPFIATQFAAFLGSFLAPSARARTSEPAPPSQRRPPIR